MALVKFTSIRFRADVKISRDRGKATSSASALVTVNFNKVFADISNIDVTPVSSSSERLFRTIVFTDAPDPTSFQVEFYDSVGTRVARDFFWEASGVLK